jgi:hypothetical protein
MGPSNFENHISESKKISGATIDCTALRPSGVIQRHPQGNDAGNGIEPPFLYKNVPSSRRGNPVGNAPHRARMGVRQNKSRDTLYFATYSRSILNNITFLLSIYWEGIGKMLR